MPCYRNVYNGIIKRAETPIDVACSKCVRVFARVPIDAHVKVYIVIDDTPVLQATSDAGGADQVNTAI